MNVEVLRRTFDAKNHPESSPERERLNRDPLTSEYMPSLRYLVRWPFLMNDGTPHPTQKHLSRGFKGKAEAIIYAGVVHAQAEGKAVQS